MRKWQSPLHSALDMLGRSVVALLMVIGLLYASAYTTGWPNLPDPDRKHRREMQRHQQELQENKCMSTMEAT